MDPFMMGLLALTAAQNPGAAGSLLGAGGAGQLIGGAGADQLGGLPGGMFGMGQGLGQFLEPQVGSPATPAAVPGAQPDIMKLLGGVKTPQADNKPIMNAGVSGSQRAPELGVGMGGGSSVQAEILAALGLLGRQQDPLRVPALGSLLGGK